MTGAGNAAQQLGKLSSLGNRSPATGETFQLRESFPSNWGGFPALFLYQIHPRHRLPILFQLRAEGIERIEGHIAPNAAEEGNADGILVDVAREV